MMRASWIAAALAVGLAAAPVSAQAPRTPVRLTLDEAVRRALEAGEEVRVARAQLNAANSQVVVARADAFPQVRAGVSYQRTFASPFQTSGGGGPDTLGPFEPDPSAPIEDRVQYLEDEYPNMLPRGLQYLFSDLPFGQANTWTGNVTVSQLLFQGGKVGAGLRGARAFRRTAEEQLAEVREDITYQTRQAFLDALFTQRLVQIAEGGKALAEEQLRRVESNQRVGGAADYDLLRAQVEAANQDPVVIEARNASDLAQLRLRQLVNVPPEVPIELDAGPLLRRDSIPEVDLEAMVVSASTRAAVYAAEAAVEARQAAVSYYKGDYWPALRANLYLGAQAYPNGFVPASQAWRKDWNLSFTISWGLFEGLRTRGQVDQARAQLAETEAQLERTREQVALQIEAARLELMRARTLLGARRQTVQQAERAQYLATVRYSNGIATQLEVTDARLALQRAQVNEAQALRDYLLGVAAVERAIGRRLPVRMVELRAAADAAPVRNGGSE
jgi:outer membrane protein TolC